MKKLKTYQYNVVSRFCEDVAKGLMLAAVLGQVATVSFSLLERVLSIAAAALASLLFLSLAIYFSQEARL